MMNFDINEYMEAFENLVIEAGRATEVDGDDFQDAFEEVCNILKIAYAEAVITDNSDNTENVVFYDSKREYNPKNSVSLNEIMGSYTVICSLYPTEVGSVMVREKMHILLQMMLGMVTRFHEEEAYKKLALHDRQLGIYNMEYFVRVARKLILRDVICDYTACCFNLKGFSLINNKVGRDEGTLVMKKYAKGLQKKLEKHGWVFRISGDTFITVFRNDMLDTVMEYMSGEKIFCEKENCYILVNTHAGYYKINNKNSTPDEIMDKANAALRNAKNVSKMAYVFYNSDIQEKLDESKRIEHIFPEAIENEEFMVYYQPKTQLRNYHLYGAEALCRWKHDDVLVPPYKFIPLLENSRDICELDFYMLEHVCRDIRRWLDEGREVVKVSVNFSRCHLGDMDLLDNILKIINKYNVPHRLIEIELTETTTDVDFEELKRIVSELRKEGINVSVDDFGVGYSSLSLIRDIPWSVLKIDKCFLPEADDNDEERNKKKIMLKSVIALSQALGIECITEGVETLDQIILLKKNNCFLAQGFYFDKPLPVEEFEKRLMMAE